MMAVPAKPGMWQTIKLIDGTEVRAQLCGDEHLHWLQAENGACYVRNDDRYIRKDLKALLAEQVSRRASSNHRVTASSTPDGLGEYGRMSMGAVPSIGEYTIPVVMVQFSDQKFMESTTVEKMTRFYNEEGYSDETSCKGSVRDYFIAQSGGRFVPTFDVVGVVTLSTSYKSYGEDKGNRKDYYLSDLPGDVISTAILQLGTDFSKYVVPASDANHRDGVPLLCILYAGKGQATEGDSGDNSDLIWPCEWDVNQSFNNVHFNSVFVGNELYTGGQELMGMGTFCHEFGHALGLPDFYVTNYSYSDDSAFGNWSVMDRGCYFSNGRAPVGYTAYERSYMGWLELKEFGRAEEVTLQSPTGTFENSAYIMRHSNTETFIFENRQPSTWYPAILGRGLLVTRIAYDRSEWSRNTLNNIQDMKRACVLTANGKLINSTTSANLNNLYGYSDRISIMTLPCFNGSNMEVNITKVLVNKNDGTVTVTLDNSGTDDPTGLEYFAPPAKAGNGSIYTIDGRYVGTDSQQLSRGIYIINGRRVMIQ